MTQSERIKQLVRHNFPDNHEIMLKIAECESNTLHKIDGQIVKSHTEDYGVMQIHLPIWGEKAKELGIDIFTLEGNIKMARYIYSVQGLTAWVTYNNGCALSTV